MHILQICQECKKMAWDIQNLYMVLDSQRNIKKYIIYQDAAINLTDFIPEPRSLSQILRMNEYMQEKWGEAIRKEINSFFMKELLKLQNVITS